MANKYVGKAFHVEIDPCYWIILNVHYITELEEVMIADIMTFVKASDRFITEEHGVKIPLNNFKFLKEWKYD